MIRYIALGLFTLLAEAILMVLILGPNLTLTLNFKNFDFQIGVAILVAALIQGMAIDIWIKDLLKSV